MQIDRVRFGTTGGALRLAGAKKESTFEGRRK
jgi:hypothetical protein